MKLGIILNTSDAETVWNALRLGNEALAQKHQVSLFLLGAGVEMVTIKNKTFNVPEQLDKFLGGKGDLMACGTCLTVRHQEAGVCPISTMPELVKMVAEFDKIVSLG